MGQTPPEGLVMAKKQNTPKTCDLKWNVTLCDMKTKLKQLK
jgi:hypothetical protein